MAPSSEEKVALVLLGITPQVVSLRDSIKDGDAGFSGCLEYSSFQCSLIKSPINFKNVCLEMSLFAVF